VRDAATGLSFNRTGAPGAGSNRTRSPSSVNTPSDGGVEAGSTTLFVDALPAVFAPGFNMCRPAMLTHSRR